MVHWEESYQYGRKQEETVLPLIQEYFGTTIRSNPNQYAKYDFCDGNGTYYELKSRTCSMRYYPDTMITLNKLNDNINLILLFNFKDCLTCIAYHPETFAKYRRGMFSRAFEVDDEKEHIYIPVDHLTVIKQA